LSGAGNVRDLHEGLMVLKQSIDDLTSELHGKVRYICVYTYKRLKPKQKHQSLDAVVLILVNRMCSLPSTDSSQ
jgi:hypothetical protein